MNIPQNIKALIEAHVGLMAVLKNRINRINWLANEMVKDRNYSCLQWSDHPSISDDGTQVIYEGHYISWGQYAHTYVLIPIALLWADDGEVHEFLEEYKQKMK